MGPERRQIGRDHHGGDVAGIDRLAADVDAESLQHRLQRLLGEWNVVEKVAGAIETNNQAVADQLVFREHLQCDEILDG
jgi:hypothetical protein